MPGNNMIFLIGQVGGGIGWARMGQQLMPKNRSFSLWINIFGEQKALHIFSHPEPTLPWQVKGEGQGGQGMGRWVECRPDWDYHSDWTLWRKLQWPPGSRGYLRSGAKVYVQGMSRTSTVKEQSFLNLNVPLNVKQILIQGCWLASEFLWFSGSPRAPELLVQGVHWELQGLGVYRRSSGFEAEWRQTRELVHSISFKFSLS